MAAGQAGMVGAGSYLGSFITNESPDAATLYAISKSRVIDGNKTAPSAYFSGDVYTVGKEVTLLENGSSRTPAYSVVSSGPDIMITGSGTLSGGRATVTLDSRYTSLIKEPVRVIVTPTSPVQVYVSSKSASGFTVEAMDGRTTGSFDWMVVAKRADVNEQVVQEFLSSEYEKQLAGAVFPRDKGFTDWSSPAFMNSFRPAPTPKSAGALYNEELR